MHKAQLLQKLSDKSALIGIVGLGYVGLPLLLRYADVGYKVVGFDIDKTKITKLNQGGSYIEHICPEKIQKHLDKQFIATDDLSQISEVDAIILCVPTPLNKFREPDLSFIVNTLSKIESYFRPGQVISLESTTYPGTTEEEIQSRVEQRGFKVGEDYFVIYSPEREDPANANFGLEAIPKVCGGSTENCLEVGQALYQQVVKSVVPVSSLKVAEMCKLLENIHRSVNIGLANEMKIVADRMQIDIHEVIAAAATKPFGFVPYYPGPGLGGHCIPIDPFYLTWKAREFGLHTRFIELAGEINNAMPKWVVNKIGDALNLQVKAINGSKILILGIAYKKNVDDMRESPAVSIMEILTEMQAQINYSDPHVAVFPKMREHHFDLQSIELTAQNLASYDCVVLVTDHQRFDYDLIKQHAKLIIDTRGVYKEKSAHIVKA